MTTINPLSILTTPASADYALLDSGDGEKLERYGRFVLRRPDPQALWRRRLSEHDWQAADASFERSAKKSGWKLSKQMPPRWEINFGGLKLWVKPSSFKHTGIFPEQLSNWEWTQQLISSAGRTISVLNLFGYTGGATLAAAAAGAKVCHVDGSKVAVAWARDNAALSGLAEKPIRWIVDDARAFVQREIKRARRYDGIILDPPAFGHGPKKELWTIEKDFLPLLTLCRQVLSERPLFFLLNGYAAGYSALAYEHALKELDLGRGKIERGELTIAEADSARFLPAGIYARFSVE